jgi:hypothetical protein
LKGNLERFTAADYRICPHDGAEPDGADAELVDPNRYIRQSEVACGVSRRRPRYAHEFDCCTGDRPLSDGRGQTAADLPCRRLVLSGSQAGSEHDSHGQSHLCPDTAAVERAHDMSDHAHGWYFRRLPLKGNECLG